MMKCKKNFLKGVLLPNPHPPKKQPFLSHQFHFVPHLGKKFLILEKKNCNLLVRCLCTTHLVVTFLGSPDERRIASALVLAVDVHDDVAALHQHLLQLVVVSILPPNIG